MMDLPSTPARTSQRGPSRAWIWMLGVACVLLLLGVAAMGALAFSAQAYVVLLGWLLVVGGALQIGGAFLFRGGSGFGAELFFGFLSIVLGAVMIGAPLTVGSLIALLVVVGLILDAVLEGAVAVVNRQPGWVWPVLIALVSLILGVVIILNPSLLISLLGFVVGVNLLIRGIVLLLAALEARKLSR